jgi:isopentenyl-diphosphate delta-isomerase
MVEEVILVDENDVAIGVMEKQQAHQQGLLHRAISVLVFNTNGELLLQQRAAHKYHSPLLWTNTCCSHPRPGESTENAATRRLIEEMGMSTDLEKKWSFTYKTSFENGLIEHEFDHVYFGHTDTPPNINPEEVHAYRYITLAQLEMELAQVPEKFTYWFKLLIPHISKHLLHS